MFVACVPGGTPSHKGVFVAVAIVFVVVVVAQITPTPLPPLSCPWNFPGFVSFIEQLEARKCQFLFQFNTLNQKVFFSFSIFDSMGLSYNDFS